MKLIIKIKTPNNTASGVVSGKNFFLLRGLFGMKKRHKDNIKTNKKTGDNLITWIVEGDIKDCLNINKRISLYETLVSGIFGSKMLKKAIKRFKFSKEQLKEVEWMLTNMTKIKVEKEY